MSFKTAKRYRGGRRRDKPQPFPVAGKKKRLPKINRMGLGMRRLKTFYHITPADRLKYIRWEGLRGSKPTLEEVREAVPFFEAEKEYIYLFENRKRAIEAKETMESELNKKYAILEVHIDPSIVERDADQIRFVIDKAIRDLHEGFSIDDETIFFLANKAFGTTEVSTEDLMRIREEAPKISRLMTKKEWRKYGQGAFRVPNHIPPREIAIESRVS